jgi:hypothetical protein
MINLPLPQDNFSERLNAESGFADLKDILSSRLRTLLAEPKHISDSVEAIKKSEAHPAKEHAARWGNLHDGVARAIGLVVDPDVMRTKLEMESRGENLIGVTPDTTLTQIQPSEDSSNVLSLDAARARVAGIHIDSAEKLLAESPARNDIAA